MNFMSVLCERYVFSINQDRLVYHSASYSLNHVAFCSNGFSSPTNDSYYIALRYNQETTQYKWDTLTPLSNSWNNWNPGSDSTTDLCTVANPSADWRWESVDCADEYYSICEYGMSKLSTIIRLCLQ